MVLIMTETTLLIFLLAAFTAGGVATIVVSKLLNTYKELTAYRMAARRGC